MSANRKSADYFRAIQTYKKCSLASGRRRFSDVFRLSLRSILLVDATIEPRNQICCLDSKRLANSQKGSYRNWPAGFDLLPVACGKAVADHVFLCVTMALSQSFYPSSQSAEELPFINHPTYLENIAGDHHEQISCGNVRRLFCRVHRALRFVRDEERWWEPSDKGTQGNFKYNGDS